MNAYIVCTACKQGRLDENRLGQRQASRFAKKHADHGIELVAERLFLEDYLAAGYVDVERPNLKPIKTHFSGTAPRANVKAPFGMPGAASSSVKEQRRALMASPRRPIGGVEWKPEPDPVPSRFPRPFADLSESGLLWLINRTVFHPRGLALSLHVDDAGNATGWSILGNGSEPITFDVKQDDRGFNRAMATLAQVNQEVNQ